MTGRRPRPYARAVLLGALVAASVLSGCTAPPLQSMPRCEADPRLGILAQSVPTASYVPCIAALPPGWSFEELDVDDDGATITLESDRADRPVEVALVASCDVAAATPVTPSDDGVRTYNLVESIDPRYAGQMLDVFPGGCVVARYDFERGPHVALVTELQEAIDLFSRRELRQDLQHDLGVRLDP